MGDTKIKMQEVRNTLNTYDAMKVAAYRLAVERIKPTNTAIYISVEDIYNDGDLGDPMVIVHANENWQGNSEEHVLIFPLEEFARAYMEAKAENNG